VTSVCTAASGAEAQFFRKSLQPLKPPCAEPELRACRRKMPHSCLTEATACAGDDNDFVLDAFGHGRIPL
jgi:hypothetical protein